MTEILAHVVQPVGRPEENVNNVVPTSTLVVVEQACAGCQACVHSNTRELTIPGNFTGQIQLKMNLGDQLFALFHSLLMPLLLGLLFAFIADWLQLIEFYGIILFICGFTLGMWLCRQLQSRSLVAQELTTG